MLGAILVRLCQGNKLVLEKRLCGFKFELGPADGPATFALRFLKPLAEQRVVAETCHLKSLNTLFFVHLLSR